MPREAANRLSVVAAALQWDRGRWIWLLLILLLLGAVLGLGDSVSALLRYDRGAIAAGGWWRLLTAHIVHLDLHHLILNELGLVLIVVAVRLRLRSRGVVCNRVERRVGDQLGALVAKSSRGMVCRRVGCAAHRHGRRSGKPLGNTRMGSMDTAVGLCGKLAWEQRGGHAAPLVVVDAHLYGAACGFAVGAALSWRTAIIRNRSRAQG